MASNLRVDNIQPSTGMGIGIGTANGSVTITGDLSVDTSKGLTVGTGATISGSTNTITASTNGSERVRITSDGKVSIGGFNPAVSGLSISNSSSNRGFEFDTASGFDSTSCIRAYDRPTTAYKSLGLTGSDIKFGINDVEKATITSGGNVQIANGNLVFSTSGTGIDFSATGGPDTGTGSSELLDDYEEGTYSPAFQNATNVNYTSQSGQYIKIGRLVRVSGEISFTTYTSFPNGWDQITLPFNGTRLNSSGSLSSDWWAVVAGGTGQSAGTLNFGPFGNPHNDTNLAFTNIFKTGNNGMGNANLGDIFTSSSTTKTIRFHITYTATS